MVKEYAMKKIQASDTAVRDIHVHFVSLDGLDIPNSSGNIKKCPGMNYEIIKYAGIMEDRIFHISFISNLSKRALI